MKRRWWWLIIVAFVLLYLLSLSGCSATPKKPLKKPLKKIEIFHIDPLTRIA